MTDVGFMASLDWLFELDSTDELNCMVHEKRQAVMEGIINAPCGCRQLLCLPCYDKNKDVWEPGDRIWCYLCHGSATDASYGVFEGWAKV